MILATLCIGQRVTSFIPRSLHSSVPRLISKSSPLMMSRLLDLPTLEEVSFVAFMHRPKPILNFDSDMHNEYFLNQT